VKQIEESLLYQAVVVLLGAIEFAEMAELGRKARFRQYQMLAKYLNRSISAYRTRSVSQIIFTTPIWRYLLFLLEMRRIEK
jgi:hypothetical protein